MRVKDTKSFQKSLEAIEQEKGIKREVILNMLSNAIGTAYKKHKNSNQNLEVNIEEDGNIKIFGVRTVVEVIEDEGTDILLEEAILINEEASLGDDILLEEDCDEFRRNAIQNAKQVVIQKIREIEKENFVKRFEDRIDRLMEGYVRRIDPQGNLYIEIEDVETFLPFQEKSQFDEYNVGSKIKVVILNILVNSKTPRIIVSRKSVKFIKALFTFEVPEIAANILEIKYVARDPGNRTKIAISSNSAYTDPVTMCVGPRGMRIRSISNELNGEKIDIIKWSEDPDKFIVNSLSPAHISEIYIDEEIKVAQVIVEQDQYGLAVGRQGQNAKLASILTGYNLNIRLLEDSEYYPEEKANEEPNEKVNEDSNEEIKELQDENFEKEESNEKVNEDLNEEIKEPQDENLEKSNKSES